MIKAKQLLRKIKRHSCDNCNRETALNIEFSFCDSKGKEFNKIILCEDCSNAITNLFHAVMEDGDFFKYDMDEITECEEEK